MRLKTNKKRLMSNIIYLEDLKEENDDAGFILVIEDIVRGRIYTITENNYPKEKKKSANIIKVNFEGDD